MFEIINHTFPIQKVHGTGQPIPIQGLGEANVFLFTRGIGNGDDLLERDYLNCRNNTNDVDVTGKHGTEETSDHHECPYRPGNKCLFFLLIVRQRRLLRFLLGNQPGEFWRMSATSLPHLFMDCRLFDIGPIFARAVRLGSTITNIGRHA